MGILFKLFYSTDIGIHKGALNLQSIF